MNKYVVELEKGVWLVNGRNTERTLKIENAKRYKTKYSAEVDLGVVSGDRLFPNHLIYAPEKQKLIEQAQEIAENGCDKILQSDCDSCFFRNACDLAEGYPRSAIGGFLLGIAFEKGEL